MRLSLFFLMLGFLLISPLSTQAREATQHQARETLAPLANVDCGPLQNALAQFGKPSEQANWLGKASHIEPINMSEVSRLPFPLEAVWIEGQAIQGEAALIWLQVAPGAIVRGQLGSQEMSFHPHCNLLWGLVAFDALFDDPGTYQLTLRAVSHGVTTNVPITLRAGDFWSGPPVRFPPDKQALLTPERLNSENALLSNLLTNPSNDPAHWKGPFQLPRNASTTSGFGARGVVNGVPTGYHRGVDYRGFIGTPFFAPAPGRVILAEALTVRGNAIFIDHGAGVTTGYFHASELNVRQGDWVETSSLLGKIGATGLTTGPHLHWELRVHGIPVDPRPWLQRGIPVSAQELGAEDWAMPYAHFYTQTANGQGGFTIADDRNARILSHFLRLGGLQTVGYPISRRYMHDGFVTQAFQKMILQWRPEVGEVWPTNVFDDLSRVGYNNTLYNTRQVPFPLNYNHDGDAPWSQVVANRQALLDANSAIRERYFSVGDPLTVFGLPTSRVIDMGNHFSLRTQRAVLQQWKVNVPWASAGQVTIANGGDMAKELGALPANAILPEGIPRP